MGQFGQELRRERESRGVALESITSVTKISGRHLLALEDEKFDSLPGGVLSKGIVRGYARVVGLDEDAWVGRYLSAYNQSGQLKDDDVSWMEFAENVGRARKGELAGRRQAMRWAGVALLLTLLGLFSWYVARFVNQRAAVGEQNWRPPVAMLPAPPEHAEQTAATQRSAKAAPKPAPGPAQERYPLSTQPGEKPEDGSDHAARILPVSSAQPYAGTGESSRTPQHPENLTEASPDAAP